MEKIKKLVGSIRFWIVTLTFITSILQAIASGSFDINFLFEAVKIYLIAVAGIGTLDSIAEKSKPTL